MEDNLFNIFPRQTTNNIPPSPFRSLTASDLLSLPSQRRYTNNNNNSYYYKGRAASDILQSQPTRLKSYSPEAEAIDRWFENIQRYEQMLEEVAAASLDQEFKDELHHINQWFRCRSDAERTAALYTVVQNASQIQIRFLITVLQQLANQNPYGSSAGQENGKLGNFYIPPNASVDVPLFSHSHSVIEDESRKRQFYKRRNTPMCNVSAISEPDDLGRRNLLSKPLGLSHPGPLYEKALAARAQLQATINSSSSSSVTNSTISSSSSSSLHSKPDLFSRTSRLRASSDLTHNSLFSTPITTSDWPFPQDKLDEKNNWTFGSLSKKPMTTHNQKKKENTWTIHEEEQQSPLLDYALEQAHARLKNDASIRLNDPRCSPSSTSITSSSSSSSTTIIQKPSSMKTVSQAVADEVQNDVSKQQQPLTGLARRR
ncbi:hypothetical protein G6F68_010032 [Rhizopus microsporus]|nr:hypothetical protein G6F67_003736 [Rhizopus microsporus]KAG1255908.1 hypothetical protein G6F68_010032 [Rhizopus microsporus]